MKPLVLSACLSVLLAPVAFAETLSVVVQKTTGVGTVRAAIYDNEAAFKANRILAGSISPAGEGKTRLNFENLKAGTYGIAVFHDVNGNEALDRNLFGAPSEPFGFSNDPKIGFSAPGFDTFAFEFDGTAQSLTITLNGN